MIPIGRHVEDCLEYCVVRGKTTRPRDVKKLAKVLEPFTEKNQVDGSLRLPSLGREVHWLQKTTHSGKSSLDLQLFRSPIRKVSVAPGPDDED